ncbi:MAG: ATP-binding protein [Thiohalomonadales bacterium]|nr:ATP-binding protein [Thiohalomonadales bacterium]
MKLFSSIRQRLLVTLLLSIIIIGGITIVRSYLDARYEVQELFDAQLAESARIIQSQLLFVMRSNTRNEIKRLLEEQPLLPETRIDNRDADKEIGLYGHQYEHKIAFQLWNNKSQLLLRSPSAPVSALSELALDPRSPGYSNEKISGADWRVFSLWDQNNEYLVQVGEKYDVRNELIHKISARLVRPSLISLPVLAILIWLGIGRGLAPLKKVASEVSRREPGYLEPIEIGPVPREILPLATALNDLLQRLAQALEMERRFTDDAAHELRTPLAALKTQAQVALRASDQEERKNALNQIIKGVDRAGHLVQQMLILGRLHSAEEKLATENVQLYQMAEDIVAELAPLALAKQINLTLDGNESARLEVNSVSLELLLRNLIGNAINYTPDNGNVQVHIQSTDKETAISISDSGPGIDPELLERVFDRFFRLPGQQASGCGLGLTIARQSAELLNAELELKNRSDGTGLIATVHLTSS